MNRCGLNALLGSQYITLLTLIEKKKQFELKNDAKYSMVSLFYQNSHTRIMQFTD